jgi:ribosomal protein S15P/S13E
MKTFTSKKVLKNSVFSYSNANITKSDLFDIHEPIVDITSTENDKNNDNNLVDRYNRLNKNLKKMKKDMKNKDLLIQKFRKFLNVGNTPYHPFNEIVYSLR